MRQLIVIVVLSAVALSSGCGTYQTIYRMRSAEPRPGPTDDRRYAHGFGLIGGGGFFFAFHRMFPAWVTWSEPINLSRDYPEGIYQIEQYQSFGQHTSAAFLSWLILFNAYHPSTIKITPALAD